MVESGVAGIGGNVESLQQHRTGEGEVSLAVGGHGPGVEPEHRGSRRCHPVGPVGGEVVDAEDPAGGGGDLGGHRPLVEGVAPVGGDSLQGGGEVGAHQVGSCRRRGPLRVQRRRRLLAPDHRCHHPEVMGELGRHRESVPSQHDRRCQQVRQGTGAMTLRQRHPPVDAAGDGDRLGRSIGHVGAEGPQPVGAEPRPTPPRGVEHLGAIEAGTVHDGKQVAPDAARCGEHHPQHRVGGDHGIGGVTPGTHHRHRSIGGEVVRSDRDAAGTGVGLHQEETVMRGRGRLLAFSRLISPPPEGGSAWEGGCGGGAFRRRRRRGRRRLGLLSPSVAAGDGGATSPAGGGDGGGCLLVLSPRWPPGRRTSPAGEGGGRVLISPPEGGSALEGGCGWRGGAPAFSLRCGRRRRLLPLLGEEVGACPHLSPRRGECLGGGMRGSAFRRRRRRRRRRLGLLSPSVAAGDGGATSPAGGGDGGGCLLPPLKGSALEGDGR